MSTIVILQELALNCPGQITGRKENVEEAKKRILNQLERLASLFSDPTSVT